MTIDIKKPIITIINILERNGFEAFIVGGCVRDSLLNKKPHDWDITTNALPEQVISCFKGYRVIETGLKHGTVTVMLDGEPYEITTYRVDGKYSDNRHPDSVRFVSSLKADLSRRDFTVNAMAYSPSVGLIDYFGGQEDLKNKLIKCVGEPDKRFQEDALRIMRAVRFASVYDFFISADTASAVKSNVNLLENIAVERISSELNKLLCGKGAKQMLLQFWDVISFIIPEIKASVGFPQKNPYHCYDVYEHIAESVANAPENLTIRLTLLFHDIGKPKCCGTYEDGTAHFYGHPKASSEMAVDILKRMRYDNNTIKRVRDLILYHDADLQPGQKNIKRWLNKIGEEEFRQLLEVRRADIKAQSERYKNDRLIMLDKVEALLNEVLRQRQCFSLMDLAVSGSDLIDAGIPQGRQIGEILNRLMDLVIDGKIENEKSKLLARASSFYCR